jgi:hypothetical protein
MARPAFRPLVAALLVVAARPAAATPAAPAAAGGAEAAPEIGHLTAKDQKVEGPLSLTYVSPGQQLEVVSSRTGEVVGRIEGPLGAPVHLAGGQHVRLAGATRDAVWAGQRPSAVTRALEAWVGRAILVGVGDAQPQPWTLRAVGAEHLTVERSRTYRVLPVRRVSEITWTELTGIDPTPRVVLARE